MSSMNKDITSLRSQVAQMFAQNVERYLDLMCVEMYPETFESPIEHRFFLGLVGAAVSMSSVIEFFVRPSAEHYGRYHELLKPGEPPVMQLVEGSPMATMHGSIEQLREDDRGSVFGLAGKAAEKFDIRVYSQCTFGPSRLDFLVGGHGHWVAVECDGHDFHERTKEQAARDRSRDRRMVTSGLTVLRFTGSEIWHDAVECGRETLRFLEESFYRREHG